MNLSIKPDIAVRVYAGILSFVCAETLTGSSLYWAFNPFYYLVTFPLYLTHILFFFSLAHHYGRRSLPDLYLFGILFALYESWVTKVLWSGYPGEDGFIIGSLLGHGIHETSVLIFYFHPVVSFLFPLILIAALFPVLRSEIGMSGTFWNKNRLFDVLFWFSFVCLSFGPSQQFESMASPFLHWGPTLLLVYAGYKFTARQIRKYPDVTPHLALSLRGMRILGGSIVVYYVVTYFLFLPDHLPSLGVQTITIFLYAIFIFALTRLHRPEAAQTHTIYPTPRRIFGYLVGISITTTIVFMIRSIYPDIVTGIAACGFLSMMLMGLYLLWAWVMKDMMARTKASKTISALKAARYQRFRK